MRFPFARRFSNVGAMWTSPRRRLLCCLCAVVTATCLHGQQPGATTPPDAELPQLYAQGMAAFQAGDYGHAAATLEALIARAEFSPQLEPVYYTLGSAYFNVGDYKKAAAAFKNYQGKFPGGPRYVDAAFALAQCSLLNKDYPAAAAQFAALEKEPRFREQALFFAATALRENKKIDDAIAALERLVGAEPTKAIAMRGGMLLAQLYVEKGQAPKAIATITKLHRRLAMVDNIAELNAITIQLGDEMLNKKFYADALECYRAAYSREQIVRMQSQRITAMQRQVEEYLAASRTDASQVTQLAGTVAQLRSDIARAQSAVSELEKAPNFTPALYIRMARCYYELDKKWEAVVVYQEIIDRYPEAKEREAALFGLIVSLADVNQFAQAQRRCEQYLREYKTGANADTVGYLLGAVALQANDPRAAETYFGRMLETQPKSPYREQIRYLLANARFMEGRHDDAAAEYRRYLGDYPKGQYVEDVNYRLALCALFSGKYEDAMHQLLAYMQRYSNGTYLSDAKYRLAVCRYAASLYDEVINDCKAWEQDFPNNKQLGEVLALLADCYGAISRDEEAIATYIRSYKIASTDEVMNYSLTAASKLLQKRSAWDEVARLFTEFVHDHPDHPTVLTALYWIGKAKAHEGKVDEAKQIAAETIKRYINDRQRDAVELLLTQLAQLCVRKKRDPADNGDPGAELDRLLAGAASEEAATGKARRLYAKAELARLRRQPGEEQRNIGLIARQFRPEDLSATLLGRAGDWLLAQNDYDGAARDYQQLLDEFPKSENVDFAYNGFGEIAYQKRDYSKALRYFSDDKVAAAQKLKDMTVGRAKTLLALGRLEEAKKAFEQVASVREWRGETTAFAVYSLGEIEAQRSHWAEANAYFQRVYVGYQKFLPWVAKAYLRSAECFEKLSKQQEAINTYREMLRNDKLASFSEAQEARRRLGALGQQG